MHRIGRERTVMRILGILAIAALSSLGQPAMAHAATDFVLASGQSVADAAAAFDWGLINVRLKLALLFVITAAIAGLAHRASRGERLRQAELVQARVG